MSDTEMFWQYADEAMRCARQSKTAEEKRALTDIAFTWSQAALHSEGESIPGGNDSAPKAKTV
jgi:hypothetical protein